MSYAKSVIKSFGTMRQAAYREQKDRKFWSKMTSIKAEEYADAIAHEVGLEAAGNFMDRFRSMNKAGLTAN